MIHAVCPQIEGVRINDLIKFMKDNVKDDYLPPETRGGKPLKYDRKWLLTVRFTKSVKIVHIKMSMSLCPDEFVKFRSKALEERKKRLLEATNSNVTTAEHIANVLRQSQMVAGKKPFCNIILLQWVEEEVRGCLLALILKR